MTPINSRSALPLALLWALLPAWAQDAPGSDPIVLHEQVSYMALPVPPVSPSRQLDPSDNLPAWLQAKVNRFEIKAFATLEGGDGTVQTERDVVTMQRGNALQRTCETNIASNVGAAAAAGPTGRYGPGAGQDQIVVLRGDLVTICK